MRRILPLSLLLASLFGVVLLAGSCQTYDFEPVVPLAISQKTNYKQIAASFLKPNMMLVVDKSGSMDGAVPCSGGGSGCTRLTEMKAAMRTFLTGYPKVAKLGLIFFPNPTPVSDPSIQARCVPPTLDNVVVDVGGPDDDASLTAKATSVDNAVQAVTALGGTPTGATLNLMNSYAPLQEPTRSSFILLLTDGEPNCNPDNTNTCVTPTCRCTLGTDACGSTLTDARCARGCLDMDYTVGVVAALKAKGIRTIVVGFGADTNMGNGPTVLREMANAGGFPRLCPNGTDAECGTGDTCNLSNNTCGRPYYQAANATELAAALGKIGTDITERPCEAKLSERPSDPDFLSVIVNGEAIARCGPAPEPCNTWTYDDVAVQVNFQGTLCDRLKSSTNADPINLEFRILQAL